MRKLQREAILISYLKEKKRYKKLAEYIVKLIRDDPLFPKGCLHTIIHRIKDEKRLIHKIDEQNIHIGSSSNPVTEKNFLTKIDDLIGIRFICLRLSDIEKVEVYLKLIVDEKILKFIKGPDKKRSFVLPIDPGETIPESINLRYSGYSSIHYQVELGEKSGAKDELKGIQVEFQLRTILEEAWGEIDHKYRYAISRKGVELPEYIHTGFYNLSAYLQVAAMHAEYLCRQADAFRLSKVRKEAGKTVALESGEYNLHNIEINESAQTISLTDLQVVLEDKFGFQISLRTFTYIKKRLDEAWNLEQPQIYFQKIFTDDKNLEFKTIFREILGREAFEDINKRNIDAINAVNFVLFGEILGPRVAQEGLKSVLRWRLN